MSRMSGPARKRIYQMLVKRDGEVCYIGGEPGTSETLVIDHWNNRNDDNRISNLHLLCRPMNAVKNPRGPGKKTELLSSVCVINRMNEEKIKSALPPIQSAELLQNLTKEPDFRHWLFHCIVKFVMMELNEVVNSGAELVRCSPRTIDRYLDKLTSSVGMYTLNEESSTGKKLITLKPRWDIFRKTNYIKAILELQARKWKDDMIKSINPENGIDPDAPF